MNFFIIKLGNERYTVADVWVAAGFANVLKNIGLHDADIDAPQIENVGDILHRTLADDGKNAEFVAAVENRRHIGGDPGVSAGNGAGYNANRPAIDLLNLAGVGLSAGLGC